METTTKLTLAPAYFAVPRVRTSTWAVPMQGTRVSGTAYRLGSIVGVTSAMCSTPANAAKDATGGEAFEDPV